MEMSRQRLRAGVIAGSTVTCPHCAGTGLVRSIESTALRVLRGLEEEAEKNRAAAVTVKIANDVAIYILNQKRHELSRIETEHGMEISFEPKDGLAAGTFELERTKSRDPGDRPRNSAVSIEAGFVPSTEAEPDYVEEVEEEEIAEAEDVAGDSDEGAEPRSFERPEATRETRDGGRRRRRRGGRGRNRDRGDAPAQPAIEAAQGTSESVQGDDQADDQDDGEANGQSSGQSSGHANGQTDGQNSGQQLGENGQPRRRRRRRGRRGGRERDDRPQGEGMEHHQTGFANEADRFGAVPDEIDTTPSNDKHAPPPAVPSWTSTDDIPDTTPSDDSKPVKKGWWQRTFSGE
jgi:ribonuclease E